MVIGLSDEMIGHMTHSGGWMAEGWILQTDNCMGFVKEQKMTVKITIKTGYGLCQET